MRFFKDDPTEIDVQWFFAAKDSSPLPGGTIFGSGNWSSEFASWEGPGEVKGAKRNWVNGSPPDFDKQVLPGFLGLQAKGPAEGYLEGVEYPGIPLGCQEDGACSSCHALVTDVCWLQVVPDFLYLHITKVGGSPGPKTGLPGMTIMLTRPPGPLNPFYSPWSGKNRCGQFKQLILQCILQPDGTFLPQLATTPQNLNFAASYPTKLNWVNFRMDFANFVWTQIPLECNLEETWDGYIDTNP